MKIYTKMGDRGTTQFFGCGMIRKDDPRIEALGALDELNCVIGLTLCSVEQESVVSLLTKIQHDLFQLGADVVGSKLENGALPRIHEQHISQLENHIDIIDEKLAVPTQFILPRGTPASAHLHLCRAITRRAERTLVKAGSEIELNPQVLRYINRLSDLLFVLARAENNEKIKEQQPIYKYFVQSEDKNVNL